MPDLPPHLSLRDDPALPAPRHFARRAAQTLLAGTAIAALDMASGGDGVTTLVYAWSISLCSWALIDFGRFLVPRSPGGFPAGGRGIALIVAGCMLGWVGGTLIGDAVFGHHSLARLISRPRSMATDLVLTCIAGATISGFFYLRAAASQQRARLAASERDATLARLSLLQSQLEPHMLFNTLANLRVLISTDPARAQAMLDQLIDFLRATLAASRRPAHPLADEFARLRDYLALMQVRMGERLQTRLDLPPALAGVPVPPLLLQPLVENAIRHGLEPQRGAGRLQVQARQDGDQLVLTVQDSGQGRQAAAAAALRPDAPPASGFGLAQVRERLHTLHGDAASLRLDDAEGGGTVAEIRLPLAPAASGGPACAPTAAAALGRVAP